MIIIIKDTDGELAEEHMKDRIGRRYSIERLHDYDSVVKEWPWRTYLDRRLGFTVSMDNISRP